MTEATRYPLSWPTGWPRTPAAQRGQARFAKRSWQTGALNRISLADARARLVGELERLGARDWLLSSNIELTTYGTPRSGAREPKDPGVAVYFMLGQRDRVLACDRWTFTADNIAAIAAHIDCIRGIDRYGVGTLDQAFAGYDALPPPSAAQRLWRDVLGLAGGVRIDAEIVERSYRHLAKVRHPDRGGSHEAMAELNAARDQALRELAR